MAVCRHVGRFSLGATYASQLPRSAVPMRRLCRWRQLCRCMSWTTCSTSLGILLTTSGRIFATITPFLVSWHHLHHLFSSLLLRSFIWISPHFDLYCSISPSLPPGWRRLSGISLWHIVRPILLNSSFSLTLYLPFPSTYLLSNFASYHWPHLTSW